MTAPSEVGPEAACSQVFTKRYGEFIFRNDTVTAFGSDRDAHRGPHSKACPPVQVQVRWQVHSWELWCADSPDKNLEAD